MPLTKDEISELKSLHERVVQTKLDSWRADIAVSDAVQQLEKYLQRQADKFTDCETTAPPEKYPFEQEQRREIDKFRKAAQLFRTAEWPSVPLQGAGFSG